MKKNLLGFTLASLLFTTGSAVAADIKLIKKANMRSSISAFSIWATAGYTAPLKISTARSLLTKNPSADKVNVTINTNSVDTNHAERDKHLRSAEFLNVAKFPQATFTSTSVKKRAMNWILPAI